MKVEVSDKNIVNSIKFQQTETLYSASIDLNVRCQEVNLFGCAKEFDWIELIFQTRQGNLTISFIPENDIEKKLISNCYKFVQKFRYGATLCCLAFHNEEEWKKVVL